MHRPPIDTTAWVANQIEAIGSVTNTEVTGPHTFRIDRSGLPSFEVLVFSSPSVTEDILGPLLKLCPNVSFAVNVPKSAKWSKSAIETAVEKEIAFGGMGHLMSAISRRIENVRQFKNKENEFVERILRQHTNVSHIDQEADRAYRVFRINGVALRIVLLNDMNSPGIVYARLLTNMERSISY